MIRDLFNRYTGYLCLSLLLLLPVRDVQAQTWPTQVNTIITPPYSPFTGDYVNMPGKMIVNLLLRDVRASNVKVRLRITIEGQGTGIRLTTNPQANTPVLTMDGGVPLRLSDADLAPYFRTENLLFNGMTSAEYNNGGKLPEDLYKICFEVYELFTGARISVSNGCANAWVILNDPPFLNAPANEAKLPVRAPGVVTFQWTPRHKGSPNAAFATSYIFQLVELMPGFDSNPQAAFLSSIPLYETTTGNTMLVYGMMGEVPLEPGRKYAWRVRAKSLSGAQEMDLFKNQGFSEIFAFTYGGDCATPSDITATAKGSTRIGLDWKAGGSNQAEFVIAYRKAGSPDAAWFEERTTATSLTLFDLEPATTYEYSVRADCGAEGESIRSNSDTVSTLAETPVDYACGTISAADSVTNMDPLPLLSARDEISAGRFKVKLIKVTGANGNYSGKGYITVPYLNSSRIEVTFNNILVNTDYQLARGVIETAYDPKWAGVNDLDKYFDGGGNTGNVATGKDSVGVIVDVSIPGPGNIKVTLSAGSDTAAIITITGADNTTVTKTVSELPVTIKDKDGNIFNVDEEGTVTQVARGGMPASAMLPPTGERDQVHEDKAVVTFMAHPDQVYAFDAWKTDYLRSQLFGAEYQQLSDNYYVSAKAVAAGVADVIRAKITITDTAAVKPDSIRFVTGAGTHYVSQRIDANTYDIHILGGPADDAQELFAVCQLSNGSRITLGKLLIAAYGVKQRKVVLVPVNGEQVNKQAISDTLRRIYGPVCVNWEVVLDSAFTDSRWDLDGDGMLDVGSGGLLGSRTREMKRLTELYAARRQVEEEAVYLFILRNGKNKDQLLAGDMPRNQQFGYLFTGAGTNIGQTAAHELAHGVFHLKHTFDGYGFGKNDLPENLLNYHNGRLLTKFQWDALHDPGVVWGVFESDADGQQQLVKIRELLQWLKNNNKKIAPFDAEDFFLTDGLGRYTFSNKIKLGEKEIDLYADVFGKGDVDLTVGTDKIYKRTRIAVEIPALDADMTLGNTSAIPFPDDYHTAFYIGFYYKDNATVPAIQFYTHAYSDYELLLKELGLDIGMVKPAISKLYQKAFKVAGDDCNKIDVIYEGIPDFVLKEADDALKWDALVSLSYCGMNETGTDEEQAILNILQGFNNESLLYDSLKAHPSLVFRLWHGIDNAHGNANANTYATLLLKLASKYWTAADVLDPKKYVYWGDGFEKFKKDRPVNQELLLEVEPDNSTGSMSVISVFGRPNELYGYQRGTTVNTFSCNIFEKTIIVFDGGNKQLIAPGIYLYHLGTNKNNAHNLENIFSNLTALAAAGSAKVIVTPGTPFILRCIAGAQLIKIPVDHLLSKEKVKEELRKTPGGTTFIEVWPYLSAGLDIALISTDILYRFAKSAPQVRTVLAKHADETVMAEVDEIERAARAALEERAALVSEYVGTDIRFDVESMQRLTAQTPGGKYLTNFGQSAIANNTLRITKPASGRIVEVLEDIMRNGDGAGAKTEEVIDYLMESRGFQKIEAKYHGVNGLDGLYIRVGQNLDEATEVIIIESKQMKQRVLSEFDEIAGTGYDAASGLKLSGPNPATGLPAQMTDSWINYVADKLTRNTATREVGEALSDLMLFHREKITKFVAAVDKSDGSINFIKLGFALE